MDAEEHRQRMCTSKRVYLKKKLAFKALQNMKAKRPIDKDIKAYKCYWCKKFHLGHRRPDYERTAGAVGVGRAGQGGGQEAPGNEQRR